MHYWLSDKKCKECGEKMEENCCFRSEVTNECLPVKDNWMLYYCRNDECSMSKAHVSQ